MAETDLPNPYPGTAPFQDRPEDRQVFFGRDREIRDLSDLVLSERQTLLFARSGVGKTSLINAGLLEPLRKRRFFPVTARVTHNLEDGPVASIIQRFEQEAKKYDIQIEGKIDTSNLCAYFESACFTSSGRRRKPVLILDQFEELFTRYPKEKRDGFIDQLADLVAGRVPPERRRTALQELDALPDRAEADDDPKRQRLMDLAYGALALDIKVVIAIREDFLAKLETVKSRIPNLFRNSLRLEALARTQAEEAIVKPAQQYELLGDNRVTFNPDAVKQMLDFLAGQQIGGTALPDDSIEPVHLQILCRRIFERVRRQRRTEIAADDLGGQRGMSRILRRYYYDVVGRLPLIRLGWSPRKYRPSISNWWLFNWPRYAARALCENGLILANGYRNSLEGNFVAQSYGVPADDLDKLAKEMLLRSESRLRGRFYELTHDSLIKVLLASKVRRRAAVAGVCLALCAMLVLAPIGIEVGQDVYFARYTAPELRKAVANSELRLTERRDAVRELSSRSDVIDLSGLTLAGLALEPQDIQKTLNSRDIQKTLNFRGSDLNGSTLLGLRNARPIFDSKSKIENTRFDGSSLIFASFAGASIGRETSFRNANLSEADFSKASMADVNFSKADLTASRFVDAKLKNIDFMDAELSEADFTGVVIQGFEDLKFTNTRWWLAYGWTPAQMVELEKKFPHTLYVMSEAYREAISALQSQVNAASGNDQDKIELVLALNSIAWYRATTGAELDVANQQVTDALKLSPTRAAILDTKAYILMQMKQYTDANALLKQAVNALLKQALDVSDLKNLPDKTRFRPEQAEILYKFALSLEYINEQQAADHYYKLSSELKYRPSHELLLVPRPTAR